MQRRLSGTVALWALIVVAWGTQMAMAGEPGRLSLAALAAREDLYDEVCIARAEGNISPQNRCTILADAKHILNPQEFEAFKRALDRTSPPPPQVAKHPTIKRLPKVAQKKASTTRPSAVVKTTRPTAVVKNMPGPTMPQDAIQPDRLTDRVALAGRMR